MSATRLLVLAVVRAHGKAHGYLVGQELMAWDADKWANTKTGSIYHALRQLTKEHLLIESNIPATESTPARTDYSISESGEAEYQKLLARALINPEPRPDMLCSGLVLMSSLERSVAVDYLKRRRDILKDHQAQVNTASAKANWTGRNALPPHVEALLSFWDHHTSCAYDWVSELIDKIEGGAYIYADDDPLAFGCPGSRFAPYET